MRIKSIKLKDITRYRDKEVSIDLDSAGPGLVAITGRNGAGKTSIIEAPAGALYLGMPSYPGNLSDVALGKDSRIEVSWRNGGSDRRALVGINVALKQPKTEAFLFDGSGEPLTDGKISTYKAAISEEVGSERLFLSAALNCQTKKGMLLELSTPERKELLSEILDTGGMQELSEAAKDRAKDLEMQIEKGNAKRNVILDMIRDLESRLSLDIDKARGDISGKNGVIMQHRQDIEFLQRESAKYAAELSGIDAKAEEKRKISEKIDKKIQDGNILKSELESYADPSMDEHVQRLKRGIEAIEAKEGQSEIEDPGPELSEVEEQISALSEELSRLQDDQEKLESEARSIRENLEKSRNLERQWREAQKRSDLMKDVPCGGNGEYSGCRFLQDARKAMDRIPVLEAEIRKAGESETHEDALKSSQVDLAAIAARKHDLLQSRTALEDRRRNLTRIRESIREREISRERKSSLKNELTLRYQHLAEMQEDKIRQLEAVTKEIESLREEAEAIRVNDSMAKELRWSIQDCERELKDKNNAIELIQNDVKILERSITEELSRRESIEENRKKIDDIKNTQKGLEADYAEWRTLETAFGRNGIQALQIDAAGPELSDITNNLLHGCFGERFDVQFITLEAKKTGGVKEVFDLSVIDHDRGRETKASRMSGGEKTIISESLSMALAIYVGRHSGRRFETLFRDETTGSLDPEWAEQYVQMLRKALEVGGFHQVVFVAHQPQIWQQADVIFRVDEKTGDISMEVA